MNFIKKTFLISTTFLTVISIFVSFTCCTPKPTEEIIDKTIEEVITKEEAEETTEEVKDKETQPMILSDSQIEVILDKIERVDSIPPDLLKLVSSLSEGSDLILIYLTITQIENVHVISLGGRGDEQSTLQDAEGHKYETAAWSVTKVKYQDPHDISSPSEFIEGSTGILVFEIPKHEKLSTLTFVYYFKDNLEDESKKKGQMIIDF